MACGRAACDVRAHSRHCSHRRPCPPGPGRVSHGSWLATFSSRAVRPRARGPSRTRGSTYGKWHGPQASLGDAAVASRAAPVVPAVEPFDRLVDAAAASAVAISSSVTSRSVASRRPDSLTRVRLSVCAPSRMRRLGSSRPSDGAGAPRARARSAIAVASLEAWVTWHPLHLASQLLGACRPGRSRQSAPAPTAAARRRRSGGSCPSACPTMPLLRWSPRRRALRAVTAGGGVAVQLTNRGRRCSPGRSCCDRWARCSRCCGVGVSTPPHEPLSYFCQESPCLRYTLPSRPA